MPEATFEVRLTRDASKDLDRLAPWTDRVVDELLALEQTPQKGHLLRGTLKGVRSLAFALPGGSVYRALYLLKPAESVCLVFLVGPHENIYDKAERRLKSLRRAGLL